MFMRPGFYKFEKVSLKDKSEDPEGSDGFNKTPTYKMINKI
jgi:hypothetical protein